MSLVLEPVPSGSRGSGRKEPAQADDSGAIPFRIAPDDPGGRYTAVRAPAGATLSPARLVDVILFLGVFSGSIVMFEPAPYDLVLVVLGVAAFACGLAIPRAIGPLVVLIMLWQIGGILNLTVPMVEAERSRTFVAVSIFLAFTCLYFAAAIADAPHRLKLIVQACTGAALIAALLGLAGYFFDIEALTRYGRAKGAFKDPNVFGPFMVLPLAVLVREFMVRPVAAVWWKAVPIVILLAGILFSFSRSAWFLALFVPLVLGFVVFLNARGSGRLRLIGIAAAGVVLLVLILAVALSIPEVRELLEQRARLTQDYDTGRLGRLARHWIGFEWVTRMPLGLGPLDFATYFVEDPHNVYLKAFLGYGWLGGLAYLALSAWTLAKLFPLMFLHRPWQPYAQCVFAALAGHVVIGWVIDSDHWRHFFLLWGLAWGMVALEARHRVETWRGTARRSEPTA